MAFWTGWTKGRRWLQVLLLMVGALCICLGVWRTEVAVVLQKAIYICLECIGIG